jgi:type IV pilus assembly protein PilM
MASPKAAWGIEIGAYAIKAIRLERDGDKVSVSDFAVIPHKKVLTTPDLDQDEMIRLGLGQFISHRNLEGETLVMSVPGHSAFARFAKLPPVEPKKVPDIVKFEAVQQIPFPIDDVEWDYQTFTSEDSPEVEVGIFAITRDRVQQRLDLYAELGVTPEALTLSPVSVYDALAYDLNLDGPHKPLLMLDIGTSATDVIVADEGRCWIRTFPLGGTHFTEAIASTFKLSYSKADKLKQEAATSKYAKQIMQAMRPVFSDLLQDLQRSIGYYQTLHPETTLETMIGLGSTFKIPGLRKFLGQQLQIEVARLDEYKKIAVTGREAASFAESAVNVASAYGLALQGVGLAAIDANLVPVKALRDQMWHSKTKWFAAAAAIVILGAGMMLYRPFNDKASLLAGGPHPVVGEALTIGNGFRRQHDDLKARSVLGNEAGTMRDLFDYRTVWPHIVCDSTAALASAGPQPELLGDNLVAILNVDPGERRFIQLEDLSGEYLPPGENDKTRRILVRLDVQLSHDRPDEFLNNTVGDWLRRNAEPVGDRAEVPYRILDGTIDLNPDQRVTIEIDEAGTATASASTSGSTTGKASGPSGRDGGGGMRGSTGSGTTSAGGGGLQAGAGGSAGGVRGGGTIGGAAAPGGGLSAGQVSGSGQVTTANSGSTGVRGGNRSDTPPRPGAPGERPTGEGENAITIDISKWAPIPGAPQFFPPGAKLYRVPITFEVELIPKATKADPKRTASDTRSQEASS